MLHDVVAVVQSPVAAFELGVLAEVFGLDRTGDGLPGYDFAVAAVEPGLLQTTSGFAVQVIHDLDRLGSADLVAVPSWPVSGTSPPIALVNALRDVVERGGRVLSLCSGAFLLAAAGLLDGRRAATHWRYADDLAAHYPLVQVDPTVLYAVDGPVLTSAGTAAALDACLHLVRLEHGADVANRLARRLVVAPHREGGQSQFADVSPVQASGPGLGEVFDWALAHLHEKITVERLASRAHISARTFARRFGEVTGTTPYRWLLEQRLLLAEQLLETTDLTVDAVAAHSGLGSADVARHHFSERRGISPTTYRRTFRQGTTDAIR